MHDPQSLHKYLYVHGDPVNSLDPTGLFQFPAELGKAAHTLISSLHRSAHPAPTYDVKYGKQVPGTSGAILPDILNLSEGQIGEIKHLSASSVTQGYTQLYAAINIANGHQWTYNGTTYRIPRVPHFGTQADWIPEAWSPGVQALLPSTINDVFGRYVIVTLGNWRGLILYKRFRVPTGETELVFAKEAVRLAERAVGNFGANDIGELDPTTISIVSHQLDLSIGLAVVQQIALAGAIAGGIYVGVGLASAISLKTSLPSFGFA